MSQTTQNAANVEGYSDQVIEWAVQDIHDFMEASLTVSGNFQDYVTGLISDNAASILIDYTNEISGEFEAKGFNNRMSKLRKQIARACTALEMDIYTIKKVDGEFQFVLAKKQAVIEPDAEPANEPDGNENDSDSLQTEASRLMAKFMSSRSIDDAAKVTEFMMQLVG